VRLTGINRDVLGLKSPQCSRDAPRSGQAVFPRTGPRGDRLRGWAYRIRTSESVRELSDWNFVTTSPKVGRKLGGGASATFFSRRPYHPGRDRATPTTPFEIDGVTQVWRSSARYAQFRAQAFPSSLPSRSRCRALAGLVRAQTSDDIRPRALCTPPPKSFAHPPRTFVPSQCCHGDRGVVSTFRARSTLRDQ
jgi:hypothetical protein